VSAFVSVTGQRLDTFDGLIGRVAQETRDSAAADVRSALLRTIAVVGLGLITLMLVFAALAAISRTITIPMRRLRSGAVEVATVRLPAAVRTIEQHGAEAHIDLPPVMPPGLVVGPETVEVAHAVDGLTAEAVRLATSQVRLRHALDEAFVSMSRRSQSMVEKQLTIIDELESVEEDPEQLRNLFRLDHLAARMRRYNDNLLVLAGSTVRTRSNTPVPIADVFRAATSEMEQYERVRLQPVGSASVGGQVAGGLIHLLAELLDNAAMYSPPTSPILLTAEFTSNGGLHLEVTDSGVGIPPAELAELNSRLATPGTIDTQIPSRMGLFVVGRLAHRGGFEVRLSPRPTGAGTVAEVLVPTQHVIGAEDSPGSEQAATPARRPESTPDHFGGVGFSQQSSSQPFPEPSSPAMPAGPEPSWPPAAAAAPLASVVPPMPRSTQAPAAAPLEAGDGLPSRVPGAALSSGPLGGTSPVKEPASQFDAFGMKDAPPPPEEQSTATALWSQRSRTEDMGQDGESSRAGSGPFGMPAETPVSDPFGIGSFNGRSVTSPSGIPLSPAASGPSRSEPSFDLPSSGRLPFSSPPPSEQPPSRPPFGSTPDEPWMRTIHSAPADDPWAGQQLPRREASGGQDRPSAPEPLFGQGLHSPGDTGGFTPPVDRMTPLTGELPWQEVAKSAAPNPQIPTPSWQQAVPEPPPFDPGPSPLEQAAYDATAYGQSSADLDDPLTGHFTDVPQDVFETPIFDSISLWFNDETTAPSSPAPAAPEPVEETWGASGGALGRRAAQPSEPAAAVSGLDDLESRWASLGDQQWMATNARAAAQPEVAGDTSVGLPRRQPGANLLPSASAAAPTTTPSVPAPFRRADADTVRGRLGSYQRGVSSARRSRQIPTGGTAAGLFTAARTSTEETGHSPENHGGQE
jgi:signal transduction histidine kinase